MIISDHMIILTNLKRADTDHFTWYISTDLTKKTDYNGLLIELQIRTLLQHAWATAVETVGLMTSSELKSGQGDAKWKRFFVLCSSLFAMSEGTSPVPYSPRDPALLLDRTRSLEKSLAVIDRLRGYSRLFEVADEHIDYKAYDMILLRLAKYNQKLSLTAYTRSERHDAQRDYLDAEANSDVDTEAVLVSVSSVAQLRRAYPNFFGDTRRFITKLTQILYPDRRR